MNKKIKKVKISLLSLVLITAMGCNATGNKKAAATELISKTKAEVESRKSLKKEREVKKTGAYLEISLKINKENRASAAGVYLKYKEPFLTKIEGATSKELILREEDAQVLHGFETEEQAQAYLLTSLFSKDIVGELGPLLAADPEIRIYSAVAAADKYPKATGAFLQISLTIVAENRASAGAVYSKYKKPFLDQIEGAVFKELIIRDEDVQVLHGFETEEQAKAYLSTDLFSKDIVGELGPLLTTDPEVRIYSVLKN